MGSSSGQLRATSGPLLLHLSLCGWAFRRLRVDRDLLHLTAEFILSSFDALKCRAFYTPQHVVPIDLVAVVMLRSFLLPSLPPILDLSKPLPVPSTAMMFNPALAPPSFGNGLHSYIMMPV